MADDAKPEGWGKPPASKKFHFFIGMQSICNGWGFFGGPLEADTGEQTKDDCSKCAKLVATRRKKTQKTEK